jgi:hypothetical protein
VLRECRSLFRFPPQLALARPDSDGIFLAATMLILTAFNFSNSNSGKDSNLLEGMASGFDFDERHGLRRRFHDIFDRHISLENSALYLGIPAIRFHTFAKNEELPVDCLSYLRELFCTSAVRKGVVYMTLNSRYLGR